MREEVLLQPPLVERSKAGFYLGNTDEAIFSTSRKHIASEMTNMKRSSYGASIRRDLKAEDEVNASAEKMETEVLRGRIDAEVILQKAQQDPLQGASPFQWGSLKRSRCSRGPNIRPKPCDLAEESKAVGVQAVIDSSVILHSSAVDLEECSNGKTGIRRKTDCSYPSPVVAAENAGLEEEFKREKRLHRLESTEGKQGVSAQAGMRGFLQASQQREYLPVTRSSLGKRVAPPNKFASAHTDELRAGHGIKDFSLPRFSLSLSRKEMEEDFLLFKGGKLPKRPRRRPRVAEKAVLYCTPGIWLADVSQNRYDVKEKKCVKEKPRGLKAMQSLNSDSE